MSTSVIVNVPTPAAPKGARVNFTNKPEVIAALREIANLKAVEAEGKRAEALRKALEAEVVRPALGDASEGIIRGMVAVKVVKSQSRKVDNALLDEAFPEASAAVVSYVPFSYLKVNVPLS